MLNDGIQIDSEDSDVNSSLGDMDRPYVLLASFSKVGIDISRLVGRPACLRPRAFTVSSKNLAAHTIVTRKEVS